MFITFSKEIAKIPYIEELVGEKVAIYSSKIPFFQIKGVLGWGEKETAKKAKKFAKTYNLPYIALEDGFICSYGLRIEGYPPLSLIVDPIGIYYDSTKPSLLENFINQKTLSKEEIKEAEKTLELILKHKISKFNYQKNATTALLKGKKSKRVLVVDQTYRDMSVILGGANEKTFEIMLYDAIKENKDADIYVKIHPDVLAGKKEGYLSKIVNNTSDIFIIAEDVNPFSLLEFFDKVYTVSSQMGFEALLLGKKVICYGLPFYAGWGLTEDKLECPRRRRKPSLLELFYCAYLLYPKYLNPKTGKKRTIFDVIEYILRQREMTERLGKYDYLCVDFHLARKKFITPFLKTPHNKIIFIKSSDLNRISLSENIAVVTWGSKKRKEVAQLLKNSKVPLFTLEDGFIRSVGLGANFVPPMSIVLDKGGIYYDPESESDLINILNDYFFTEEELELAEKIRKLIVKNEITKYNVEKTKILKRPNGDKKVILVPGQVEDDEAVLLSKGDVKTNLSLLKRVREKEPDSFIIYKPHPDIISGLRQSEKNLKKIYQLCDHIETEADITSCLKICDEVHTISSLSGFDALLREKIVYTYGSPFYAGWGLTKDEIFLYRKRKLSLNELVAGTLLIYPIYFDWKLKGFVDCETVINRIVEEKKQYLRQLEKHNFKFFPLRRIRKLLSYFNFLKWLLFRG